MSNMITISRDELEKIKSFTKIGEGAYGRIYRNGDIAYKIFKENEKDEYDDEYDHEYQREILDELSNIKNSICVFPNKLIKDENGKFIGYTMDYIKGKNIEDIIEDISFEKLEQIISNAMKEIEELSKEKIDFSDLQIMWEEQTESLKIIDTDEFCIFEGSEESIKENNLASFEMEIEEAAMPCGRILWDYLYRISHKEYVELTKKEAYQNNKSPYKVIDILKTIAEKDFGVEFNSLAEIKEKVIEINKITGENELKSKEIEESEKGQLISEIKQAIEEGKDLDRQIVEAKSKTDNKGEK